jgi:hypothetical protein
MTDHPSLVTRLRQDKCMIPSKVPGIYEYGVRPLSAEAANAIEGLLKAIVQVANETQPEAVKDHHDILRMVRALAADDARDSYLRQVAGGAENLIDALASEIETLRAELQRARNSAIVPDVGC